MTAEKTYRIMLSAILAASVYPVYMGAVMILAYFKNGGISAADYPSYVIPYTPICFALIACVSILPVVYKRLEKFALPILSALGALLFLAVEVCLERITVFVGGGSGMSIETWQLFSCVATPQVRESVWDSLSIKYNPLFKIHFYAISLLIILAVTGVAYGFYKMAKTQDFGRRKPLVAQLISTVVFIGLCVLACFTAFFRTGDINVSPLSAVLMTVFFLLFGITAGVYTGTWLYGKPKLLSIIIPSAVAIMFALVMYIGELVMMGWQLFRLGSGFLFERLGALPLSLFDLATVVLSGVITYFILIYIKAE